MHNNAKSTCFQRPWQDRINHQRRFAQAGAQTPSEWGPLQRNDLSVSTETACRFPPKSPAGNSEICSRPLRLSRNTARSPRRNRCQLPRTLLRQLPPNRHTVLTDNGSEFTDPFAVDKKANPKENPGPSSPITTRPAYDASGYNAPNQLLAKLAGHNTPSQALIAARHDLTARFGHLFQAFVAPLQLLRDRPPVGTSALSAASASASSIPTSAFSCASSLPACW